VATRAAGQFFRDDKVTLEAPASFACYSNDINSGLHYTWRLGKVDDGRAGLPPLNVLIQVNVSGEATKSGVAVEAIAALARAIAPLPRLHLRGLMAVPEPTPDVALQRMRFRTVKAAFENLKGEFGFDTLSMGMSDDMESAIAEGATLVRIGSAIFGARRKERSAA